MLVKLILEDPGYRNYYHYSETEGENLSVDWFIGRPLSSDLCFLPFFFQSMKRAFAVLFFGVRPPLKKIQQRRRQEMVSCLWVSRNPPPFWFSHSPPVTKRLMLFAFLLEGCVAPFSSLLRLKSFEGWLHLWSGDLCILVLMYSFLCFCNIQQVVVRCARSTRARNCLLEQLMTKVFDCFARAPIKAQTDAKMHCLRIYFLFALYRRNPPKHAICNDKKVFMFLSISVFVFILEHNCRSNVVT